MWQQILDYGRRQDEGKGRQDDKTEKKRLESETFSAVLVRIICGGFDWDYCGRGGMGRRGPGDRFFQEKSGSLLELTGWGGICSYGQSPDFL